MKAESMQLFVIPITQNYQGVPVAPNHGDASHITSCNFKFIRHHLLRSTITFLKTWHLGNARAVDSLFLENKEEEATVWGLSDI